MAKEGGKLWGGRFSQQTDPVMSKFNCSLTYDKRLWQEDILGSKAYVKALEKAGIVTAEEKQNIEEGLNKVQAEWEAGKFVIMSTDEDIHTAVERRLKELIGVVAGKLHTGRSRNDQVATDMRLWMLKTLDAISEELKELILAFINRAKGEINILIPGYTHLQKAQPIRWSHFLMSYAWSLYSDLERLRDIKLRTSVLPLGSGAIAGSPLAIDRQFLAKELGFQKLSPNSIHAVSDRDFIVEFLNWSSLTSSHLSRLAEDLILYCTAEFGFIKLAESYSTGSSLMPQKKNADSLELIRGKAGRIFGHAAGFMMTMKGIPSAYNKDMQEDKEATFDVADTIINILKIAKGVVSTLEILPQKCLDALSMDMLATDVAYYLVRKGTSFREAHNIAGQVVFMAEKQSVSIDALSLSDLQTISKSFDSDIMSVWNYENSVEQYQTYGGTSKKCVQDQITKLSELVVDIVRNK